MKLKFLLQNFKPNLYRRLLLLGLTALELICEFALEHKFKRCDLALIKGYMLFLCFQPYLQVPTFSSFIPQHSMLLLEAPVIPCSGMVNMQCLYIVGRDLNSSLKNFLLKMPNECVAGRNNLSWSYLDIASNDLILEFGQFSITECLDPIMK